MAKLDLKKELRHLYQPSAKEVVAVEVPPMNFLMVDGEGDPNRVPEFQEAVEALYGVSYTLKFMLKKSELAADYVVLPLEGLWWTEDMREFSMDNKDMWKWTLMIIQPDLVTADQVAEAIRQLAEKKNPPALGKLRFERFEEGRAAQILHVGPYDQEPATIEKLHDFITQEGSTPTGKHHEIYLSDPRRTRPERLKTILRQPFE